MFVGRKGLVTCQVIVGVEVFMTFRTVVVLIGILLVADELFLSIEGRGATCKGAWIRLYRLQRGRHDGS